MPQAIQTQQIAGLTAYRDSGNLAMVRKFLQGSIRDAWQHKGNDSILLFGYPGGGKTSILDTIGANLRKKYKDGEIITVGCHSLVSGQGSVLNQLQQIEGQITGGPLRHRVILLDEFDAISPDRSTSSDDRLLCYWCMDFLESLKTYPSTVLLVLTNFPKLIDPAVVRRVNRTLYLPFPDHAATRTIVQGFVESPHANAVHGELSKRCASVGVQVTVAGLVKGMSRCKDLGYIQNKLPTVTVPQVIDGLIATAGFPSIASAKNYEDEHIQFKTGSELLLKCYS
jgi:SpoVK/Ycf46/Vps4 family AAA+-type ATPase